MTQFPFDATQILIIQCVTLGAAGAVAFRMKSLMTAIIAAIVVGSLAGFLLGMVIQYLQSTQGS